MSFSTRARVALAAVCAALMAPAAVAQAIPARVTQGEAHLPTSGLVIDLPAKAGIRYDISGSWALSDGGASFDTRDIVDEIETATGNVATGNWVLSGYFTAGGCNETLATAKLDGAWTQDAKLWGETWSARGGVFTFENALGRRPAVVLCRGTQEGPTLLLYHFLANQPETLPQAAVMESVGKSGPLAAASKSFTAVRAKPIFPTRRTEVRNRGSEPAARRVTLALSGLEVDLPPDGYLWLPDSSDTADFFDRLLPTFPEVTLETIFVPNFSCANILSSLGPEARDEHRPLALPDGWLGGPAVEVEGETELTMCRAVGASALVVGVFQGPDNRDVSTLYPMLGALQAAAEKK
jgi:hypothetical protein